MSELARVLDRAPLPDFLDQCKVMRRCRLDLDDIKNMNPRERAFYQTRVEAHLASYNKTEVWGPIIAEYLKTNYRHLRIVGCENY